MDGVKRKVLLVDDTPENLRILMETLKDEFAVIAATNGEKALRLAIAEPRPDIVLLDVMMPEMDGYEVCFRLKADARTRDIPVIFVTALTDEEDEARGLALGAVDFLTKPFRPGLVKARVRNHIELKAHRDHLEEMVRERTRELLLTQEVTVESLAALAEYRDPETGGHIKRTQHYVRLLAEFAASSSDFAGQLSPEDLELLYRSAPLHDIGKVGIPDHILRKPGKLTDDEFAIMRTHTVFGRDTIMAAERKLGGNSFLRFAREIAYGHHERWDGTGYPEGLEGNAIPLSARIMAVADVYDALISRRVYKPPFPHGEAVMRIVEKSGTHFDPRLIDAFVELKEAFRQVALRFADFDEERLLLEAADPSRQPTEEEKASPIEERLAARIEHER